jgi:hypothetical protein
MTFTKRPKKQNSAAPLLTDFGKALAIHAGAAADGKSRDGRTGLQPFLNNLGDNGSG